MSKRRPKLLMGLLGVLIVVVAILFGAARQFGAHYAWFASQSRRPVFPSIPVRPLEPQPVEESFADCKVGPLSLKLPTRLRQSFGIERDSQADSINLRFTDGVRTAVVNLTPLRDFAMFSQQEFPARARRTDLELYREVAAADTGDFSFAMNAEPLRRHQWLIENRQVIPLRSKRSSTTRERVSKATCCSFQRWRTATNGGRVTESGKEASRFTTPAVMRDGFDFRHRRLSCGVTQPCFGRRRMHN